jgi:hypothetical protein
MSTDKQRYSIQNQAAVIATYAHARNLKIVRTYADEGESGLRIKNRAGLRQLIRDISGGEADYGHLLVYDVSRWGRFQDTDESAHYEFICKQAGVKVEYCAEQFDNDGSMLSSIVKNLKRVMAAEYTSERDYTFIDAEQAWTEVMSEFVQQVATCLRKARKHVVVGALNDHLRIDGKVGALFRLARAYPIEGRLTQWRIPQLRKTPDRWIVATRLTDDNESVLDYLTIPTEGLVERYPAGYMRLTDQAQARLRFNRFETAEALARGIASAA